MLEIQTFMSQALVLKKEGCTGSADAICFYSPPNGFCFLENFNLYPSMPWYQWKYYDHIMKTSCKSSKCIQCKACWKEEEEKNDIGEICNLRSVPCLGFVVNHTFCQPNKNFRNFWGGKNQLSSTLPSPCIAMEKYRFMLIKCKLRHNVFVFYIIIDIDALSHFLGFWCYAFAINISISVIVFYSNRWRMKVYLA